MTADETKNDRPLLGIDIGGTKISVCLGTRTGRILEKERFPAEPGRGPEDGCDRIAQAAGRLAGAKPSDIVAPVAGVSAPGPLSSREGKFLNPPNMPGWHGFPIRDHLEKRLGLAVRLMNDANAAACAEWRFGAGRGAETLIYFTMSTGMGAGLIVSGRLHEGLDDLAGEVGQLPVSPDGPVGFGRRGSLEGFCSGPGICQLAVLHLTMARHEGRESALLDSGRDHRLVTMEEIGAAARAQDAVALEVLREVGEKLGQFSSALVDLLNPEVIVVGTIGRLFGDLILPAAREEIDRRSHPGAARRVTLVPAALGEETGDLGAICAALEKKEPSHR